MKKKTALIVLYTALVIVIAAFVALAVIKKEVSLKIILRSVSALALCAAMIIRVSTADTHSNKNRLIYEQAYRSELADAFCGDDKKRLHNRLLTCIALYDNDKYTAAVKKLRSLLPHCQTDDDYCAVLMFLALCYSDMGLPDLAIDTYKELIKHDDTRSTVWSNLGLELKRQGRHNDALLCYENALKHDDKNPYAYNNIAGSYFAIGEYDRAIENAGRALELKGDLYQASNTICLACCALGDFEKCERYYKMSIDNGAEPEGLRSAIERIKSGDLAVESPTIIPDNVNNALSEFDRKTQQPYVGLRICEKGGKSRFGGAAFGRPPLDCDGKPMRLLCALYCSEIHGLPDFPTQGILQFYIAANDLYGADLDNPTAQKNFRVIYCEDESIPANAEQPEKDYLFPVDRCFKLELVPSVGAMTYEDYRFADVLDGCLKAHGAEPFNEMEDDLADLIIERYSSEEHRIGGYPCFTQTDPRDYDEELRKYDTLLLQIVSEFSADEDCIMIGDCGVINFFIPREKLKQRDFSDVMYWWDCC